MNKFSKFICVALLLCAPSLSVAGFRCTNGKLVQEGDTTLEVEADCGAPAIKEYVGRIKVSGVYVNLDRWAYNQHGATGEGPFLCNSFGLQNPHKSVYIGHR
jgi:hypothetical protein